MVILIFRVFIFALKLCHRLTPYSLIWLFFSQSVISVEQQVVVHWASETLSESSDLLKDRDGSYRDLWFNVSNGDGVVVTLGYFDTATSDHPFNGNWVPLTDGNSVLVIQAVVMDIQMELSVSPQCLPKIQLMY